MDRYFYSQKENGFFTDLNKAPSDAVEITTDEWLSLLDGQDNGMKIVSNQEGYPVLTELRIFMKGDHSITSIEIG